MLMGWGSPTRAQTRERLSAEARPGQPRGGEEISSLGQPVGETRQLRHFPVGF